MVTFELTAYDGCNFTTLQRTIYHLQPRMLAGPLLARALPFLGTLAEPRKPRLTAGSHRQAAHKDRSPGKHPSKWWHVASVQSREVQAPPSPASTLQLARSGIKAMGPGSSPATMIRFGALVLGRRNRRICRWRLSLWPSPPSMAMKPIGCTVSTNEHRRPFQSDDRRRESAAH